MIPMSRPRPGDFVLSTRSTTVSVIIPTMNRPAELRRCLESILLQTHRPAEVIVVDDGDSDVASLTAVFADSGVRFIYEKKNIKGPCRSRNIGVRRSTGDVLVFLDDDTELDRGYIQAYLDIFDADSDEEIGGLSGAPTRFRHGRPLPLDHEVDWEEKLRRIFLLSSSRTGRILPSGFRTSVVNPKGMVPVEFLQGGNMAVRRRVFHEFSFDESFDELVGYAPGEDVAFSYPISRRFRLYAIDGARLKHFHAPGGRPDRFRLARARVIHQYRFLDEVMRGTALNRLAFGWAMLGLAITHTVGLGLFALRGRGVKSQFAALRGVLSGISHILRHPSKHSDRHRGGGLFDGGS
jgi:glycosyltransferase involved in cell wall biosynthesis